MSKPRLIVVDDEPRQTQSFAKLFSDEFDVVQVNFPGDVMEVIDESFCVALVDERMGGVSGIDVLRELRARFPNVTRILMTAYGDEYLASAVNQARIFHYAEKPFGEELRELLREAVREHTLRERGLVELRRLAREREMVALRPNGRAALREALGFSAIAGKSESILSVIGKARKAVDKSFTVLVGGETGTGKGLFAQAIHYEGSSRTEFRSLNCGQYLDESIVRSELFGSVQGAFTGALNRPGVFEAAHTGTVFLDEIGDMPLAVQALLLTFLDSGEFMRVGSTRLIRTDVRVIAATHRDLYQQVKTGKFREDLYYRLAQFEITLPPLRERREDIPLLADQFLERKNSRSGAPLRLSEESMKLLWAYPFPGNVRELHFALERASAVCEGTTILPEELPDRIRTTAVAPATENQKAFLTQRKDELECDEIRKAIASSKTQKEAARKLGRTDRWLREKMKEHGDSV